MQDRETVPVFILCGGLEEGDILNGVINALPGYMHPGILISVQEFPLNASRNVERETLIQERLGQLGS